MLLIGLGPVKVTLVYVALTKGMDPAAKRRVVYTIVVVAGAVAVGLLVLGGLVQRLLHFSEAAMQMAGGLILLLLALNMVMGAGGSAPDSGDRAPEPSDVAIFPLAIPLTLNPIGIVALITYSSSTDVGQGAIVLGIIAAVLLVDLAVLLAVGRVEGQNEQVVKVLEVVLGILLAALAMQLILNGLEAVGIAASAGEG